MQNLALGLLRAGMLSALAASAIFGQINFASVTGIVTDPAQSVAPGVKMTIRNMDTGIEQSMETNGEGYFTITELPPGLYELTASKPGFASYRETSIVLQLGQTLRNDVKLQVGSMNEMVQVRAEIAPLNTENGAIKGDVIDGQEIQNMPLNGRDFSDLAFLVSGVLPNAQGGAGGSLAINGARADNTNYYIDGLSDRNALGGAAQLRPNIDAMQEFKMEVGGFSAEYGKLAGGILNVALKSGTNQFHGTLFEYFRSDRVDARAYYDPRRLPLHLNQFGGTVTGPVMLPKYNGRDRTFFLFSVERYIQIFEGTSLGNVPTALERSGDFTRTLDVTGKQTPVKDPFNGNAVFPGNAIPAARFNPIAVKLLPYWPLPNRNNLQNNFQTVYNNWDKWHSVLFKVDHRFSSADNISLRYGKRLEGSNLPLAGSNLAEFQTLIQDDRSLGGADYTHLFTPTLINEARLGFSRSAQRNRIDVLGHDTASQLGIGGSTKDPALVGLPLINVTGLLSLGYQANTPFLFYVTDYQAGDKMTWIKGKHVIKFGVDFSRGQINEPFFTNVKGTTNASGSWTGAAFGDLMLGLLNASSITQNTTQNYIRYNSFGSFVNDDYKVTHTLTLNLGMRYELTLPPTDKYDRLLNFVPELNKIVVSSSASVKDFDQLIQQAKLTSLVALRDGYGIPRSLVYANYKNFAPRFGFAWRPFGSRKTVLRGGYGIFYSGTILNDIRVGLGTSFPFATTLNFNRLPTNQDALTLANPWPSALGSLVVSNTSTGFQLHPSTGYMQSYSFTVEREVGKGTVVEAAFVGSKGTHLGRQFNLNMPYRTIFNYQATGTFPSPYPALGTINYWTFDANSIYNAGEVTLRKRAAGGFFYRMNYTYSKSIDTASQLTSASNGDFAQGLDARNLTLERARSGWDRGHVFNAAFSWQLPVGRGRRFLAGSRRLAEGFLGGWQFSATSQLASGPPLTVQNSNRNQAIGESIRPNRIASGKDVTGAGRRGIDYPWFDPAVFIPSPDCLSRTNCPPDRYGFLPFAPGNSGRNILDAPSLGYVNTSLQKNFSLGERRRIQFRYEVFNLTNHPNFQLPNRNANEVAAGIITTVLGSGRGGPRLMQFALKFEF